MASETPIEVAEHRVHEAAMRVERQRNLIAELQAGGHSTVEAEQFLRCFQMTQRQFENVVARAESKQEYSPPRGCLSALLRYRRQNDCASLSNDKNSKRPTVRL
jgi:hypothetical protein